VEVVPPKTSGLEVAATPPEATALERTTEEPAVIDVIVVFSAIPVPVTLMPTCKPVVLGNKSVVAAAAVSAVGVMVMLFAEEEKPPIFKNPAADNAIVSVVTLLK